MVRKINNSNPSSITEHCTSHQRRKRPPIRPKSGQLPGQFLHPATCNSIDRAIQTTESAISHDRVRANRQAIKIRQVLFFRHLVPSLSWVNTQNYTSIGQGSRQHFGMEYRSLSAIFIGWRIGNERELYKSFNCGYFTKEK